MKRRIRLFSFTFLMVVLVSAPAFAGSADVLADSPDGIRVSYLGPAGTYTEEAAQFWFQDGEELLPKDTVNDAVAAVVNGEADFAVIPQENTLGGAVVNYVDALIAAEDVYVVGEVVLPISQTLMGVPGAALSDIKVVCSHTQGLTQSTQWRQKHLPNAEPKEMDSTAAAAKYVAEQKDPTIAAIAAPGAASLYGLETLAENVQITDTNKTRFYVLAHVLEEDDSESSPVQLANAEDGQSPEEDVEESPEDNTDESPEGGTEEDFNAVFIATCEGSQIDDIIIALHDMGFEMVTLHDRPEGSHLGMYHYVIEVKNEAGITDDQIQAAGAIEYLRFAGCFNTVEKQQAEQ